MVGAEFASCSWLRNREQGQAPGRANAPARMYGSLRQTGKWASDTDANTGRTGGVFGLEFTPDGTMLGAVTEQRSIVFVDPLRSAEFVSVTPRAHNASVNCIRFVDSRLFATCSDDHSVRLWDIRNMADTPVRTLKGHSNWVKNVELIKHKGLLVTSSFDNFVMAWDLNDSSSEPRRLFHLPSLTRMRITPAGDKMILSTHCGYIFVVHHLDVDNLGKDLFGFKPYQYWMAHAMGNLFPVDRQHNARFSAARNRAELVFDFPDTCDPDNVSSIAVHPHGWVLASRCTNVDDRSEWTCIHDIQLPVASEPPDLECNCAPGNSSKAQANTNPTPAVRRPQRRGRFMAITVGDEPDDQRVRHSMPSSSGVHTGPLAAGARAAVSNETSSSDSDPDTAEPAARRLRQLSPVAHHDSAFDTHATSQAVLRRLNVFSDSRRELRLYEPAGVAAGDADNLDVDGVMRTLEIRQTAGAAGGGNSRIYFIMGSPASVYDHPAPTATTIAGASSSSHLQQLGTVSDQPTTCSSCSAPLPSPSAAADPRPALPPVHRRLCFYTTEPRSGRGYIKEQAWSPDGRVLASPHGFGIRLLGFNEQLSELPEIMGNHTPRARPLHQLCTYYAHTNSVVSCKFSDVHAGLLATGCLNGEIALYQMRL